MLSVISQLKETLSKIGWKNLQVGNVQDIKESLKVQPKIWIFALTSELSITDVKSKEGFFFPGRLFVFSTIYYGNDTSELHTQDIQWKLHIYQFERKDKLLHMSPGHYLPSDVMMDM